METTCTPFMRDLELDFKRSSGLVDRSAYKIFYCQVRPAQILTLGINPGGSPANTQPNGLNHLNGVPAAASASFYENDEHDILDCEWRENTGLRKVLMPLLGGDATRIRTEVVKTNLAFQRSARVAGLNRNTAFDQSAPFLSEIINVVKPRLVLLTGVPLHQFTDRFTGTSIILVQPERDPNVNQVVFAAAKATLLRPAPQEVMVVQVAHASQFGWTYGQYRVAQRILDLMKLPSL